MKFRSCPKEPFCDVCSCLFDIAEMYAIRELYHSVIAILQQIEEKEESIWASALSCLLYFVCDRGKIRRNRLKGLDIRVSCVFFPCLTSSLFFISNYFIDEKGPKYKRALLLHCFPWKKLFRGFCVRPQ